MLTYVSYIIFCLFVCVMLCFFSFDMQLLACLIFCNGFAHCFIHFCCQNPHFFVFCFLQVFLGATSSFSWGFCRCSFCFTVVHAFVCFNFVFRSLFALDDGFFMFFLAVFVASFFFQFVIILSVSLPRFLCGFCRCDFCFTGSRALARFTFVFRSLFALVDGLTMFFGLIL